MMATPLQFGENSPDPKPWPRPWLPAAGCVDYVMPDAERIDGVSGWMDAAALAAAHEIEMSSHLFLEVTAHPLAATPTAHWLEYVDWAEPLLQEPLQIRGGLAMPSEAAGWGLAWNKDAVGRF